MEEQEKDIFDMLNDHMNNIVNENEAELNQVVNKTASEATEEAPESLMEKIKDKKIDSDDDDLDFGDMPNGKIRYEKAKLKIQKLEELLNSNNREENNDENTEDDESTGELENLKLKVSKMEEEAVLGSLKQREDAFWSNYTPEERAKWSPIMELEIRRSDIGENVLSGKVSLEKVMSMVNPAGVKKSVQSANLGGKKNTVSARATTTSTVSVKDLALKVLDSPKTTNAQRAVAIEAMTKELMKDIL